MISDCKKTWFLGGVEQICADAPTELSEELACKMHGWVDCFRSAMELEYRELDDLYSIIHTFQNHIMDISTPPGEKLVTLVCLCEVERETARRKMY